MSKTDTEAELAVRAQLNRLETGDLVRLARAQPELEYMFRHALVQDAAYSSLLRQDRRRLHQAVGEALEQRYQRDPGENAAVLADHFREAGDDQRALRYYTLAAEHEAAVYANVEADMHYQHAIEIANRRCGSSDLLSRLVAGHGRVLELRGQYDQALARYSELQNRGQQSGDLSLQLEAYIHRATLHSIPTARFDPALGEALSQQALELSHALGDRKSEARIWWNLQLVYTYSGRHKESVIAAEKSLAITRELNLREQMAYTLNDMKNSYVLTGHADRAQAAALEARALWREMGNLPMLADNLNSAAGRDLMLGNLDEGLKFAQDAYDISLSIGNLWGQAYSLYMQPTAFLERAQFSDIEPAIDRSVHLSDAAGILIGPPVSLTVLALMYYELGMIDQGMQVAQQIVARVGQSLPALRSCGLALQSLFYCLQGDLDKAVQTNQEAFSGFLPENAITPMDVFLVPAANVNLLLARGEYEHALVLMEGSIKGIEQSGMLAFVVDFLLLKGTTLRLLQRFQEAREVFDSAAQLAKTRGCRRVLWKVLVEWSTVETELCNHSVAVELYAQSQALVETIAAQIADPDLLHAFMALPMVGELLRDKAG